MAEVAVLRDSFRILQMEMRANALGRQIRDFSGEGGKRFKDWLGDIDRVGQALNADNERYRALCYQTLKGSAGNFFSRHIQNHPNENWPQTRQVLKQHYSEEGDAHWAGQKLRRLTQRTGESIQNFVDRIITMGREAYQDINQPLVQSIMVDVLIDGTKEDSIAKRLIKERPNNLDQAMTIAVNEQTATKNFKLRRRVEEEPMEVDSLHQVDPREARIAKLEDNMGEVVSKMSQLLDCMHKNKDRGLERKQSKHKWTTDNKPICSHCNKIGHMFRECRGRSRPAPKDKQEN